MILLAEDKALRDSIQSIIDRRLLDDVDTSNLEKVVRRMDRDIERSERLREMIEKPYADMPGGEIVCGEV